MAGACRRGSPVLWLIASAFVIASIGAQMPADWLAPAGRNFPVVGGNLGNQRYSTLTGINKSTLNRLGGAWMVHLEDGNNAGNLQTTPVVVDGVMYVGSGLGNVLAIDAKTGGIKWKYRTDAPGTVTHRGVAAAEGKVFAAQRDNTIVALDQKTGAVIWRTPAVVGTGNLAAPVAYYNGLVYMGVAGGEGGVRGQFAAYDAKTGKEAWRFWTIPGPGEPGHETWEGESWRHGGAPVWIHPAIDPALGLIYIATGNAWPDNDGTERGGDNLFTASLIALDLKTGAYRWHFQEVRHDIWDYDTGAPVLADVRDQGQTRKVVMHAGKTGVLYVLDRTNGKPLIGVEERPVPQEPRMKTAKTQPFPIGDPFVPTCPDPKNVPAGMQSGCLFAAYWTEPVLMAPGTLGGLSWAPMTFSPQTNLIYITGSIVNSAFGLRRQTWDAETNRPKNLDQGTGFFRPPGMPRSGNLTAMDPTTNRIVWQKPLKFTSGIGSGLLSTAAGLLFHGEPDGHLVAYDIANGEPLWSFQTGAGADAPVITYEIDGEQYVAIVSAGSGLQLSQRGDSLWAFRLGGTVPPAAAPVPPPPVQPGVGRRGGGP